MLKIASSSSSKSDLSYNANFKTVTASYCRYKKLHVLPWK